jgi:hypothetical protein
MIGLVAWFTDLHTNLLGGQTGRKVNGFLSIFVVIMSVTGLVLWWPGTGRVKRSLRIEFKANWKRLNWDLHSVIGLWMFAFVFVWGVTGIYVVFPMPFQVVVNHFSPLELYKLQSSIDEAQASAHQTHAWRHLSALVLLPAFRKFRWLAGKDVMGSARPGANFPLLHRSDYVVESRPQPRCPSGPETRGCRHHRGMI